MFIAFKAVLVRREQTMTALDRQETLTRRLSGAAIVVAREAPISRLIFQIRRRPPMSKVFEVLKRLDDAKVHYFIGRYRPDTIHYGYSGWRACRDFCLRR
ncbi:hypothetical protein ACU8L2_23565 [Rhizobium leguminosarum]